MSLYGVVIFRIFNVISSVLLYQDPVFVSSKLNVIITDARGICYLNINTCCFAFPFNGMHAHMYLKAFSSCTCSPSIHLALQTRSSKVFTSLLLLGWAADFGMLHMPIPAFTLWVVFFLFHKPNLNIFSQRWLGATSRSLTGLKVIMAVSTKPIAFH